MKDDEDEEMIRPTDTWVWLLPSVRRSKARKEDYGKWVCFLLKEKILELVDPLNKLVEGGDVDKAKYMPSWKYPGKYVLIVFSSLEERGWVRGILEGLGVREMEWKTDVQTVVDTMTRSPDVQAEIDDFVRRMRQ